MRRVGNGALPQVGKAPLQLKKAIHSRLFSSGVFFFSKRRFSFSILLNRHFLKLQYNMEEDQASSSRSDSQNSDNQSTPIREPCTFVAEDLEVIVAKKNYNVSGKD